jgi:hypothetical protein
MRHLQDLRPVQSIVSRATRPDQRQDHSTADPVKPRACLDHNRGLKIGPRIGISTGWGSAPRTWGPFLRRRAQSVRGAGARGALFRIGALPRSASGLRFAVLRYVSMCRFMDQQGFSLESSVNLVPGASNGCAGIPKTLAAALDPDGGPLFCGCSGAGVMTGEHV